MSANQHRRIVNPLLNASVTGGTLEEFSQNIVLMPAAEAPPMQQPSSNVQERVIIQSQAEISNVTHANESITYFSQSTELSNFPPHIPHSSNIAVDAGLEECAIQHEFTTPIPSANVQPSFNDQHQNQSNYTEPGGLQSVFSSFSSYLKLGSGKQEEDLLTPVPSVVDSVLATVDPNATVQPVQFYSPSAAQVPPPLSFAPPSTILTNSYRRGLKRPTYAPIPGYSSESITQPPQIPANLPPNPPKSHSPFTPFVGNPLQTTVSSEFPPPPSALPPHPGSFPQVQQIERIHENLQNCSPFLKPVSDSEEFQLTAFSSIPFGESSSVPTSNPSLLPSSNYYPNPTHSTLLNPEMATSESARASPVAQAQFRSDSSGDHPVLTQTEASILYRPVYHHWFFKKGGETKPLWMPFSMHDSLNLETEYLSTDLSPDKLVSTDGGRYDVNILLRERTPVYWEGSKTEVRRCSWFHKSNTDRRYVPYEENVAAKLEEEFKTAFETSTWNRKVEIPNGEAVVFHGPDVLVLFPQTTCPDSWGNTPNQPRPRVVKRGMDEFHIDEGEPTKVDHLLFLVHGIGSVCDLKFRNVEEVVDEFRNISLQLVQSHYRSSCEKEIVNRIEVLPISWHEQLHSDETGVDRKMKGITLESIPRLRAFTNDTILDVLFYTSPMYCQTIISTVGNELNRIFGLFKQRNPSFAGGVSLGGHSLGSLIIFDILSHQHPEKEKTREVDDANEDEDDIAPLKPPPSLRRMARRISYMHTKMGTGQPQLHYPHLIFSPCHFFALGSPVGMFVTIRGLDNLGEQFALPTCPAFFNIFHPYDPVAFRIESLVNPELANLKPVLIPHHKGRKRMHLELKETMARVGADLKQKLIDSMKSTWNSFYQFTLFKSNQSHNGGPSLEEEVNKVVEEQMSKEENASDEDSIVEAESTDLSLGVLNQGRRIDYVLQEAPLEFINEYIFALTSHVCYWESEDTILLIVKEIYNSRNVSADCQIPQQTMKIERTSAPASPLKDQSPSNLGMDPTIPMASNANVGPPPLAGFVRKS